MPPDFNSPDITELIEALNEKKAIIVAGAGVTSATVNSNQRKVVGSWTSLLNYGLKFCREYCDMGKEWEEKSRKLLAQADTSLETLLTIGDEIWDSLVTHEKLEGWLSVFNEIDREQAELIGAIKKLGIPISTANYDNLLEDITGLTQITPQEEDSGKIQQFVNSEGTPKYILHLHGHYKKPASIVLGKKSYEAIVKNEYAQFINRALALHFKAMIFVGFGKGVSDPNFNLIFQWVSRYFPRTKMYHLVTEVAVAETQQSHRDNGNKNVVTLGYGQSYDDLAPFLRNLSTYIERNEDFPKSLPGRPECIGEERQNRIEEIASYLWDGDKKPVGIIGTGGIGKTNLVLNILHHQKVANKFGRNRYFIKCDPAISAELLCSILINTLEIPPGGGMDPETKILNYLQGIRVDKLVVLDNFETPLDLDTSKVGEFVKRLQGVTHVVYTMRGGYSPAGLDWKIYKTALLQAEEAEDLFHINSDRKFIAHHLVKQIVKELDYLPLAVVLIAKRAKSVEKLESLYEEWKRRRNELLKIKGSKDNKDFDLNLSIQLSFESSRLNDDERDFLKAISYLPAGIKRDYLETLFDNAFDLLDSLKYTGLCEEDPQTERITILAPIREYINNQAAPTEKYLSPIISFYLRFTQKNGSKVGSESGAFVQLETEWPNIVKTLENSIETEAGMKALLSITMFCQFTGYYLKDLLKKATNNAERLNLIDLQANCLYNLGLLELHYSRNQESGEYFLQAMALFERSENLHGKINCLKNLGNLEFRRSRNKEAEEYYRQAIPLYEKIGSVLGKANCLHSLGELEFQNFRTLEAEKYHRQAMSLYEQEGSSLGKANCLICLADMELHQSRYQTATEYFDQARTLYEKIGNLIGKANSLRGLGDVELKQDNFEQAGDLYTQAHSLYLEISDPYSEGLVLQKQGLLYKQKNDLGMANSYFCQAKVIWLEAGYNNLIEEYELGELDC